MKITISFIFNNFPGLPLIPFCSTHSKINTFKT